MKKTTFAVGIIGLLLLPFAQEKASATPAPLLEGLKGYWKLDETNSTRFDSTTNHFDLSPLNNVQANTTGKLNGAASFTAAGNPALSSAIAARAPLAFSGDWTVSSWVKHTGSMANDSDHVFSKAGEIYFFIQNYNGPHHLHLRIYGPGTALDHEFAYVVPANEWRHLVLERAGNTINLFVNGALQESVAISGTVANAGYDFLIGRQKDGWSWNGLIDETGYWGRSLTSEEISTLYGDGTPPTFPSFFDEGNPAQISITSQPESQTHAVGSAATFTVAASGPEPLSYQWNFEGTPIVEATASTFTIAEVEMADAGIYTVLVSSTNDFVLSLNATLAVLSPSSEVSLLNSLKAYWKLDETSSTRFDSSTNNFDLSSFNNVQADPNGKLNAGALFQALPQNQGLQSASNARAPLAFSGDWTVSSWAKHSGSMAYDSDHVFSKAGEIYFFIENYSGSHHLHVRIYSGTTPNSTLLDHQFAYIMPAAEWRHLILERDGNNIKLVVDGALQETVAINGTVQNLGHNFLIGMQKDGWTWNGVIDEVGYWGRSLTSAEISTLYCNGVPPAFESFGEEGTPAPLLITEQPSLLEILVGGTATLSVGASGPAPLGYQWNFEGTPIASATDSVLTLPGVTTNDAGIYTVLVSSTNDTVLSAPATLTVVPPTVDLPLLSGLKGYWKLNETSGTRFDSTTNRFHLSPLSNVQADPNGKVNGSASFDALENPALSSTGTAQAPLAFSGDWTVSSWVKHTGNMIHDSDHIFSKAGEIYFFIENYDGPHHLHVRMSGGGSLLLDHQFAYVVPADEWTHLVLERSGNSINLFVDGALEESVAINGVVENAGHDFLIGSQKDGWSWNGLIDEVGYWGYSLSSSAISSLHGNGTPPAFEALAENPYLVEAAGHYNGLFYEMDEVLHQSSGFVAIQVTRKGQFSAKLLLDGDAIAFTRKFGNDGTVTFAVSRQKLGKPNLTLFLAADSGSDKIFGTVTDGEWTAPLVADRAVYNPTNLNTNFAGIYTMLLPGATEEHNTPSGYGYGAISINTNGKIKLSGKLADTSPIRQSARISKNGQAPFFSRLYRKVESRTNLLTMAVKTNAINFKGSTLGWLTFTNSQPVGAVSWIKTAITPTDKYHMIPFTNQTDVLGSLYTQPLVDPTAETPDLGSGTISFAHGDLSAYQVLCATNIDNANVGSALISFNSKSGLFRGSFVHPDNLKQRRTFNGAFLQQQNCGGGFFLSTNQVGLMLFRQD